MRKIARNNDIRQIKNLKNLLFTKNKETSCARYFKNTFHHSVKLRITQALAFLFRLDSEWDYRLMGLILEEVNQVNVTHINELMIAETVDYTKLIGLIEKV